MFSSATEMSKQLRCNGASILYALPAVLSMLFATLLLITDFIIPCVINKKVINLIVI